MLSRSDLRKIARARIKDAKCLLESRRYDGAVYLCGYAIELSLKARIVTTLGWQGFPSTRGEFQEYQSFRTHGLDVLLHLSGRELQVKRSNLPEWSVVAQRDETARYQPIGTAKRRDAELMIQSAETLLTVL